ncbi:MAG: hypothetical protein CfP315_0512 [Candidatus Improbicoccus pseudotrichonymphae]|uniref:Uncharacterized protein n=1 Tax=Candidatus Improbicoccus pseudotrichonymphae TaxID=3033792 RepID=A0AA48IAL4_9FIRM|nr:MAG: hypothetical protein CfP315_0512 [Candidatus Improbicoccus pseudotrichonymphae]
MWLYGTKNKSEKVLKEKVKELNQQQLSKMVDKFSYIWDSVMNTLEEILALSEIEKLIKFNGFSHLNSEFEYKLGRPILTLSVYVVLNLCGEEELLEKFFEKFLSDIGKIGFNNKNIENIQLYFIIQTFCIACRNEVISEEFTRNILEEILPKELFEILDMDQEKLFKKYGDNFVDGPEEIDFPLRVEMVMWHFRKTIPNTPFSRKPHTHKKVPRNRNK